MHELDEVKLRNLFFDSLFDYFSDNLPSHLYPEERIRSTVHDLLDLLIDDYEFFLQKDKHEEVND